MPDEQESQDQGGEETGWSSLVAESSVFSRPIQQAIGRAVLDPDYRDLLFQDPDAATQGLGIPESEAGWLTALDRQFFDAVVADLEQELARGVARENQVAEQVRQQARDWEGSLNEILGDEGFPESNGSGTEAQQV